MLAQRLDGRSALHASEIFLMSANMMREQMEPTGRLHYQILNGGEAVNVIPDYSKVLVRYVVSQLKMYVSIKHG